MLHCFGALSVFSKKLRIEKDELESVNFKQSGNAPVCCGGDSIGLHWWYIMGLSSF